MLSVCVLITALNLRCIDGTRRSGPENSLNQHVLERFYNYVLIENNGACISNYSEIVGQNVHFMLFTSPSFRNIYDKPLNCIYYLNHLLR